MKPPQITLQKIRKLTAIITLPDAENCSPAMSISTVVSAPMAGCETQARKCRTTNSYTFCYRLTFPLKTQKCLQSPKSLKTKG